KAQSVSGREIGVACQWVLNCLPEPLRALKQLRARLARNALTFPEDAHVLPSHFNSEFSPGTEAWQGQGRCELAWIPLQQPEILCQSGRRLLVKAVRYRITLEFERSVGPGIKNV